MIVFDTGLGPPHEVIDELYKPARRDLEGLLADAGAGIDDVEFVVNCHLHFDHCGGNQLFSQARIVAQRAELEASRAPMYTVREWVDFPGADIVQIDGRHELCEGVRIVPTPGHTAGHQSLVLDTPDGPMVLAGQAAESAAGFEEEVGGWAPGLEAEGVRSIKALKALRPARVLFAHDDSEWLPTRPSGV